MSKKLCFLKVFLISFNLGWILVLQLTKVVFSLVFPIFWHPWHPWSRIKQTILINETISCNLALCAAMSGRKLEAPDGHHREKKSRLRGLLACTQGVLPSKYVLSLTMYGRWLLCHGLFFCGLSQLPRGLCLWTKAQRHVFRPPTKKAGTKHWTKNLTNTWNLTVT